MNARKMLANAVMGPTNSPIHILGCAVSFVLMCGSDAEKTLAKAADDAIKGFAVDKTLRDTIGIAAELARENAKLTAALEQIALLDESHAFEAVAIATNTLGKHPSQIFSERQR